MPYSSPATVSAGQVITSTWGNSVRTATNYLANPPACRVYRSTAQSIAHNTNVAVTFDSERFDPTGMHSTSSNTSRITISDAGLYVVGGGGRLAAATDYTRIQITLFVNGATVIQQQDDPDPGTANVTRGYTVQTLWKFAASDYVELLFYHTNGASAARNLEAAAAFSPEFYACWVGLG